ncbi:MAG: tyrosine--tRNA ligase [Patescibacteria group bacterium]
MQVNTDPGKIDEILSRATVDVIVKEELRKELSSGRPLKIYLGTDPTGGDLHLGHATIHLKLRDFQELGHKVTLLVGDYTVLVGDHSDKTEERVELKRGEIEENMKTYKEQFGRSVDLTQVAYRYNSEWLAKLSFNEIIELSKIFTLQQMTERDAFQKRVKAGKPVGFDELLYPIMQGYDAYALQTDIQIGGTDQLFNLQAGRKIMDYFKVKPQAIITCPLLVGNDGRKMGKSLKNYISINSSAKDKYFGIMTIVDEIIINYFTLLTRVPMDEIAQMQRSLDENSVNPRDLKMRLAFEITKHFHGVDQAHKAQAEFKKVVQNKELPESMAQMNLSDLLKMTTELEVGEVGKNKYQLLKVIACSQVIPSNAETRRLIEQGGVEINGDRVTDIQHVFEPKKGDIIKVGKKKYIKII